MKTPTPSPDREKIRSAFRELTAALVALHGPSPSILKVIFDEIVADAAENNGVKAYTPVCTEAERRVSAAIGAAFSALDSSIGADFDEPNPGPPGEDEWVERMRSADYRDLMAGVRIAQDAILEALAR